MSFSRRRRIFKKTFYRSKQRELSKLFKPITESQKETKESLVQELMPIKEGLKELPAIAYPPPQLQAIAAPPEADEEDEDEESMMQVGAIAHRYLSDYAAKQNVDKTLGIYKNPIDKQYYIGNEPIDIDGNNLIVGDMTKNTKVLRDSGN